jgi:hypothetical protein
MRAPHLYIATAARFVPGKSVLTPEQKATFAEDLKHYPTLVSDISEPVLMSSRAGSTEYQRTFMEGFIRPGPDFRNWTSRSNYPACGVVQTSPTEMSMYVERQYGQAGAAYLQRFVLRLDGFSSLHAGASGGELITNPVTFTGRELHLNVATGAAGNVSVELKNTNGETIPGFSFTDCQGITGDDVDRTVTWNLSSDLSQFIGQPVHLHFLLKDADVYSLQFRD